MAVLVAIGLILGAAACSDDDDGGDVSGGGGDAGAGETPPSEGGDVEAANDAVIQEYCDASEAYAAALEGGDPEELEAASGRLGEASDAVSPVVETFTPEQQAQFEECTDAQGG
jgi:hypothetical protein